MSGFWLWRLGWWVVVAKMVGYGLLGFGCGGYDNGWWVVGFWL